MAAPSSKPVQAPKSTTSPTSFTNATARLEKAHPGVRRSTPDSDALASSDDDGDHSQQTQPPTSSVSIPKPGRRTSWLNEVPPHVTRKSSLTTTAPLSSGASNPTSPATDQSVWSTSPGLGGSIAWNHVGSSSFPWGTGIWNSESRKEPPPRLSEIVPSPTTSNTYLAEELLSPTARASSGDAGIPFSIPLHPTPKTYRSQSYSVGQLDPEFLTQMASKSGTAQAAPYPNARPRNSVNQLSALQHRSSRPSLLGELGHDPATLDRVREDEDDEEEGSANGSDGSMNYTVNQARTIEQLSRENALLRQAAMDNSMRDRRGSTASANGGYAVGGAPRNLHAIRGSVPEETDLDVHDLDELHAIHGYNNNLGGPKRRFSEHSANLEKQFSGLAPLENRALDNVRKAHWQTSLGFDSIPEIPQSRRHSFADIPMRHTSISSAAGDSQAPVNLRTGLGDREDEHPHIADGPLVNAPGQTPSYFSHEQGLRMADEARLPTSLHSTYSLPHHGYGRHQPPLAHFHQNQLLYIVTFKCHRADVFYIQEDTGLQVKPGDLVIVEADRGTDLGTIQHANVSLQKARELKQQYAEEHYKWLMMFSRQGQNGGTNVVDPSGNLPGLNGRSAIGGMGPHGSHGGPQEPPADIKPKLIKRLAQNHEILTLRDKEGNEAKAKRVCQQKVVEHRLNMEILDAEFQMDWKKLTFYYFADSYINFNSLVTDLFKIYKTRIWMSAINPASFATPPGVGLPSSGAMSNPLYQEAQPDRRHQHDARPYGNGRDLANEMLRNPYADNYQSFGQAPRHPEAGLGGFGMQSQPDPISAYGPTAYGPMETGFVDYAASPRMPPAAGDWTSRFQGLSLGS